MGWWCFCLGWWKTKFRPIMIFRIPHYGVMKESNSVNSHYFEGKSQKKKKKTQLVYCSFSQFKWKSHSNVLQEKLSHFISWGRKTIVQGPVKPSTTDITACLLEDKSAKEITALPVSNNAVTFGVKVSCEHEDWVIQSNMELHFCLTIWQRWQDLQFSLYSSGISTNSSSKKILQQGCWSIQRAD